MQLKLVFTEFEKEDTWIEAGWLNREEKPDTFLSLGTYSTLGRAQAVENLKDTIYTLTISMARKKWVYKRRSYNISEWMDETGGLLLSIEIFFMSVLLFFTGRRWKTDFVKKNWRVNLNEQGYAPSNDIAAAVESEISLANK